jgi:hypothetical protein
LALVINSMHLKNPLCQVNADYANIFHGWLLSVNGRNTYPYGTLMPNGRSRPPHQARIRGGMSAVVLRSEAQGNMGAKLEQKPPLSGRGKPQSALSDLIKQFQS